MNRLAARPLAALILVLAVAGGCATSSSRGAAGNGSGLPGNPTAGCGSLDPGFCGRSGAATSDIGTSDIATSGPAPTATVRPATGTGIPGVVMVPPHYVNDSEIAEPSHSPPPCPEGNGSGFSMSIAQGAEGYSMPQAAIDAFVAGHRDYDNGSAWRIVYDGFEMTASSGNVSLDILGLPNANWIVDAGERC